MPHHSPSGAAGRRARATPCRSASSMTMALALSNSSTSPRLIQRGFLQTSMAHMLVYYTGMHDKLRELRIQRVGPIEVPIKYQTIGSAGLDLHAALDATLYIQPGERWSVNTGIAMAIPVGYEGQVRSRSGMARNLGLIVLNSPGTIDWDYRGEIQVLLWNTSEENVAIEPLDRIAQLVIAPVVRPRITLVETLDPTERGEGGFGSTGTT